MSWLIMGTIPFIATHLDAALYVYLLLVSPFMATFHFSELLETVSLLFYTHLHLYCSSVFSTFYKLPKEASAP